MTLTPKFTSAVVAAVALLCVPGALACSTCGCSVDSTANNAAAAQPDIVDTAIAAGQFETLVAAVQAAGLVDALKGEGPYTVFAPTDEAFAALPEGALEGLLADPEALAQVLLYHVVAGEVTSADVVNLSSATTLQGQDV
ncbi:fasciclin domain-containing protein, partial [Candidatus Sumerlaeota bacterium]|nr:fasciclin domain-containing protein [Candidatus Sumerlaeota bacterium]